MRRLVIEIDDEVAGRPEQVAPAGSRQRAELLRAAIRRVVWDLEERATAAAYRRQPDRGEEAYLDAALWERRPRPKRQRKSL